jgi:epothilone synthetase B
MILADLLTDLEKRGIRLWPDNGQLGIRAPKGALTPALRDQILQRKSEILNLLSQCDDADSSAPLPQIVPDPDQRYLPFPLTDIQQAYWVGRTSAYELGNVSIHMYWELERAGLDLPRLETAWRRVIDRHDMLRAVVSADGQMQILEHVPPYPIAVLDLRGKEPEVIASQLDAVRQRLSHQVLPVDEWPSFEVQACLLDGNRVRVHISVDLVHIDASSLIVMFRDWIQLYRNPEISLPPLELSFRDYVLAERKLRDSKAYHRSLDYWRKRVAALPPAPELPLARNPGSLRKPRFVRRTSRLEPPTWLQLKTQASHLGLTTSAILLTAYARVLAAWGKTSDFTVNVTLFNRRPVHPQVNDILGDFTSMILLEVVNSPQETFEASVRRLQIRLWSDLEYSDSSGVESLRELARVQQRVTGAIMPIVFTSLLSLGPRGFQPSLVDLSELGEVVYEITQTPQIWLDHQVFEEAGALVFNWDAVEELFPSGLLDDMFGAYCRLVQNLAEGLSWQETALQLIPPAQLEQRAAINSTDAPIPPGLLQTLFEENARQRPDQPAVITSQRTLTYEQLDRLSNQVGHRLRDLGIGPNTLVAVVMEKGWEQMVAVLGILKAGGAYLPVDADFPSERIRFLIENGEAKVALLQSWISEKLELPDHVQKICIDNEELAGVDSRPLAPAQTQEDLAYVLYTSGSTGKPKGVMIEQRSVINRMADVAKRFGLKPQDRAIAITALHHDLSVFDIFGILSLVGGSIVIPDAEALRDPAHWAELMSREKVTVWNSVPTFMQMLVEHLENGNHRSAAPTSLRWVIMSGDFIPVDLPDRLRELIKGVDIVGAGGPTETTVWDICYPIGEVDPTWKSIPYGRPLANAQYHVLKDTLEPCPVWVPGELYIAGVGLARGYWRDEERTQASFITHPKTGQRLYRSGDMGRYLPDGNIEIMGRKDLQVKIRGYRIELGEIEAALAQHPAVRAVVVRTVGEQAGDKRLVAYVVPNLAPAPTDNAPPSLANEKWLHGFSEHQLEGVIHDPIERLAFVLKQPELRRGQTSGTHIQLTKPELNEPFVKEYLLRRSHRKFLPEPIPFADFSAFMTCIQEVQLEGSVLPKYRYPSAGSLYPVRTYLYIAPERVEGLAAGTYSYDPENHRLRLLSAGARIDRRVHFGVNQSMFDASAFSLFFIGDLGAIAPLYGDLARDFCMIEAGCMVQLMMTSAPAARIGLCSVGALDFQEIRDSFHLEENHIYLHSLIGGPVNPDQPRVAPVSAGSSQTSYPAPPAKTNGDLPAELRRFLTEKLPEFMVPSAFVLLEALPLTPNGKLDYAALPSPTETSREPAKTHAGPQTEMELTLATILGDLLGTRTVGIHENFFDLGANSLHMVRFSNKLKEVLKRDISVVNFFKYPSISSLAEYLSQEPVALPSSGQIQQQARKQIEAARKQREMMEKRRDG